MALACQRDSYLKKLSTQVKSSSPAKLESTINGKKQTIQGYEVILEDTILFPEGGGQPDDRGMLNDLEVMRVTRQGAEAVHFVTSPLEIGSQVKVTIQWQRRWDHMQQHSDVRPEPKNPMDYDGVKSTGQHLVTALADSIYGYPTTSWNLGEKTSFIELDTPTMTPEQVERLEEDVNERIRQGVPMYSTLYESKDDSDTKLQAVRTRGLPEDHAGPVRVVTIEGIDTNMCCGTHVSNLGHLQAITLLGAEKGKKGKVNLLFVAGDRVLQSMHRCYQTEKAMTGLLKGHPDQHVELVDKLQKSLKVASKVTNKDLMNLLQAASAGPEPSTMNALTVLRDMAVMEAAKFKMDKEPLLVMHRKEGDNEFMNIIVNEVADESVLMLLSVGDEQGAGMFLLAGTEAAVNELAPKVAQLLDGKGGGKKGRFQGKASRLSNRPQVETILQEYIQRKQEEF